MAHVRTKGNHEEAVTMTPTPKIHRARRLRGLRPLLTLAALALAVVLSVATSVAQDPALTGVSPKAGETGVAADTSIRITFDWDVDEETVTADSVRLLDPDGLEVPVTLSLDDTWEITITPDADLAAATTYTVVLDLDLLRTHNDQAYELLDESLGLTHDPEENTVSYTFTTAP